MLFEISRQGVSLREIVRAMYVCICNAVCSNRVAEAIDDGHHDPESVYAACGVRPKCGMCAETIEEMIWNHKASAMPMPAE